MVPFTRTEFIRLSFWLLVLLMPLFIRLHIISTYFFFFPPLTINILSQNNQLTLFLIISKIDWAFQVFQCTAMWLFPILWSFLWLSLVPF